MQELLQEKVNARVVHIGLDKRRVALPNGAHLTVHFDICCWTRGDETLDMAAARIKKQELPGTAYGRITHIVVGSEDGALAARRNLPSVTSFELAPSELTLTEFWKRERQDLRERQKHSKEQLAAVASSTDDEDDDVAAANDDDKNNESAAAASATKSSEGASAVGTTTLAALRKQVVPQLLGEGNKSSSNSDNQQQEKVAKTKKLVIPINNTASFSDGAVNLRVPPSSSAACAGALVWRPGQQQHFFLQLEEDLQVIRMQTDGIPTDVAVLVTSSSSSSSSASSSADDVSVHFLSQLPDASVGIETFHLKELTWSLDCPRALVAHIVLRNPHYRAAPASSTDNKDNELLTMMGGESSSNLSSLRSSSKRSGSNHHHHHHHHKQQELLRFFRPAGFCAVPTHPRMDLPEGILLLQTVESSEFVFAVLATPSSLSEQQSSSIIAVGTPLRPCRDLVPQRPRSAAASADDVAAYDPSSGSFSAMHCATVDPQAGTMCLAVARRDSCALSFFIFSEECIRLAVGLRQQREDERLLKFINTEGGKGDAAAQKGKEEEDQEEEEEGECDAFIHHHSIEILSEVDLSSSFTLAVNPVHRNMLVLTFSATRGDATAQRVAVCIPVYDTRRGGWATGISLGGGGGGEWCLPLVGTDAFPPAPLCCPLPGRPACDVALLSQNSLFMYETSSSSAYETLPWSSLWHAAIYANRHRGQQVGEQQQAHRNSVVKNSVVAAAAHYAHDLLASTMRSVGADQAQQQEVVQRLQAAERALRQLEATVREQQTSLLARLSALAESTRKPSAAASAVASEVRSAALASHRDMMQDPELITASLQQLGDVAAMLRGVRRGLAETLEQREAEERLADAARRKHDEKILDTLSFLTQKNTTTRDQ